MAQSVSALLHMGHHEEEERPIHPRRYTAETMNCAHCMPGIVAHEPTRIWDAGACVVHAQEACRIRLHPRSSGHRICKLVL